MHYEPSINYVAGINNYSSENKVRIYLFMINFEIIIYGRPFTIFGSSQLYFKVRGAENGSAKFLMKSAGSGSARVLRVEYRER